MIDIILITNVTFQLSQKYKSSADLVSELLRKPVFTRYRSMKKKSNYCVSNVSNNPCEPSPVSRTNKSVIKTTSENLPQFPALQSVDLVKNCPPGSAIQKLVSEHKSNPTDAVEVATVQMRLPVTMRPRLATVNSDCDEVDHVTDSSDSEHMINNFGNQHGFEVKKCKSHVFNGTTNNTTNNANNTVTNINNKTNISDKSTSTVTPVSLVTLLLIIIDLSQVKLYHGVIFNIMYTPGHKVAA